MPVVVLAVMSPFLRSYLTVVWFGLASFLVAGLLLGISALIRPNKPNPEKLLTYESGVDPVGDGWSQSQIRYYVFALLFVIFDVVAIFLYAWGSSLLELPKSATLPMLGFLAIIFGAMSFALYQSGRRRIW